MDRLDAIPLSKEAWLQMVLAKATSKHAEDKDSIAAMRLYGEGIGIITRGTPAKEVGSPGEWIDKTLDMQKAISD
jgi:hypothetical protein